MSGGIGYSDVGGAHPGGGCYACRYFGAESLENWYVVCIREAPKEHVTGQPHHGCSHWEREPGSDDELSRLPHWKTSK